MCAGKASKLDCISTPALDKEVAFQLVNLASTLLRRVWNESDLGRP